MYPNTPLHRHERTPFKRRPIVSPAPKTAQAFGIFSGGNLEQSYLLHASCQIETQAGPKLIAELTSHDLLLTASNSFCAIQAIQRVHLPHSAKDNWISVAPGFLGNNDKITLYKKQLIRSDRIEHLSHFYNQPLQFFPASALLNDLEVLPEEENSRSAFELILEAPGQVIFANQSMLLIR